MDKGDVDSVGVADGSGLLRTFYRADWAKPTRDRALWALRRTAEPGFSWRLEARRPSLIVSLGGLEIVGDGIEHDFSSYVRQAAQHEEIDGMLVVSGWIVARSRLSGEIVRRPFRDRWSFRARRPCALVSS